MYNQEKKSITTTPDNFIYSKLPASVEEQILILKSRGMLINNERLAKIFLSENYFHRFLSYSVPFFESISNNNSKCYKKNVYFEDVVRVYEFDSKLRLLVLEAIEKIEISIKTQFIHLSWKYGAHFYLNHKLFKDHKLLNDSIERLQYQIRSSNDLLMNDYFAKYHDPEMPPVWVAMELISIGQLAKWLINLKNSDDKHEISKRYKLHYTVLQSVVDNLTQIRNYAAHHARIWNRHYNFIECVVEGHNTIIGDALCSDDNRIYSVLILITYILHFIGNDKDFVSKLVNNISLYQIDVNDMGFPYNWRHNFDEILNFKS